MTKIEILSNVTMFVFVVGTFIYGYLEIRRQDKEFAEWQKESEKRAQSS